MYDEADLEALKSGKEIGRQDPFTTETESQRLSRDPMILEDWESIIGNNCCLVLWIGLYRISTQCSKIRKFLFQR